MVGATRQGDRMSKTTSLSIFLLSCLLLTMSSSAAGTCVEPPPGLQSWWGGDGNAADVFDAGNGTLAGDTSYGDGIVSRAFLFDGTGDWVEVSNPAAGDFGSAAFSVAFWFQSATDGYGSYVMGKSHPDSGQGWDIRLHDRRVQLVGFNGWPANYNLQTGQVVTAGQWHHLAISSDGQTVTLYIDGSTIPEWTIPRQTISTAANPLRFGFTSSFGGFGFNGLMDEVMFYSRALNAGEVSSIASDQNPGVCRPCTALPVDALAWWRADNSTADEVGGFDGSLQGDAAFVDGKVNAAFGFSGAGHVALPKVPEWDFGTSSFSLAAWFASDAVGYRNIIRYHDGGGGSGWWGIRFNPDGHLQFLLADATGSPSNQTLTSSAALADGGWHHVVAVRDATGGQLRLYVDGAEAVAPIADAGYNIVGDADTNVAIGTGLWGDTGGRWEPWVGEIDEVMIFNRALSESEVQALTNAAASGVCTRCTPAPGNMLSWWKAEDDAIDTVGGNDGSLVNGATYADGLVDRAFSLESANDYIEVPHAESLSFGATDPMSIDFWAKRTGGSAVGQHLIGKRAGCGGAANWQIVFDRVVNNGVCFAGDYQTSLSVCSTGGSADLPVGEWTHIAFTFDGITGRLYLDGKEAANATGTLGAPNTTTVRIGTAGDCGAPGINYDFHGLIDEVEIHDRALSLGEVLAIKNAGANGKCDVIIEPLIFSSGFEAISFP